MISCPACQKQISATAEACPDCGHEIRGSFAKRFLKGWLIVFAVLIGLAALNCIGGLVSLSTG